MGVVVAVCVGETVGGPKRPVASAEAVAERGLAGDAPPDVWHRQICLLTDETLARRPPVGADAVGRALPPGTFGENLRTRGIDLDLAIAGSTIRIDASVLLEVAEAGDGPAPALGTAAPRMVFARVLQGGVIRPGDAIEFDTLIV